MDTDIKPALPRSQNSATPTRHLNQKHPRKANNEQDTPNDPSELLDYAVGVENRLRNELRAVLKQLEHEQGKSRKLERRVRDLDDALRCHSRAGTASPPARSRTSPPHSTTAERERTSSPTATDRDARCATGGGSHVAARSRARLATSQTVWLQQRGGSGRPPALDRLDPADAARSKPALLAACEQAIANDLRRLGPAGPGEGELPAVRARLEVFQTAFDAIIENFQVHCRGGRKGLA